MNIIYNLIPVVLLGLDILIIVFLVFFQIKIKLQKKKILSLEYLRNKDNVLINILKEKIKNANNMIGLSGPYQQSLKKEFNKITDETKDLINQLLEISNNVTLICKEFSSLTEISNDNIMDGWKFANNFLFNKNNYQTNSYYYFSIYNEIVSNTLKDLNLIQYSTFSKNHTAFEPSVAIKHPLVTLTIDYNIPFQNYITYLQCPEQEKKTYLIKYIIDIKSYISTIKTTRVEAFNTYYNFMLIPTEELLLLTIENDPNIIYLLNTYNLTLITPTILHRILYKILIQIKFNNITDSLENIKSEAKKFQEKINQTN